MPHPFSKELRSLYCHHKSVIKTTMRSISPTFRTNQSHTIFDEDTPEVILSVLPKVCRQEQKRSTMYFLKICQWLVFLTCSDCTLHRACKCVAKNSHFPLCPEARSKKLLYCILNEPVKHFYSIYMYIYFPV